MDRDRPRLLANRNCYRLSRVSWALAQISCFFWRTTLPKTEKTVEVQELNVVWCEVSVRQAQWFVVLTSRGVWRGWFHCMLWCGCCAQNVRLDGHLRGVSSADPRVPVGDESASGCLPRRLFHVRCLRRSPRPRRPVRDRRWQPRLRVGLPKDLRGTAGRATPPVGRGLLYLRHRCRHDRQLSINPVFCSLA